MNPTPQPDAASGTPDNPQAFPCINPHYDGNWQKNPVIEGMTLRDYFAAGYVERNAALEAENRALRDGVQAAMEYANGRWDEWGTRAETVRDMLEATLAPKEGNAP